ncbi:MAG TPA: hydantoinase/oxoprolinase family protein [Gemmatimonadales bacterium]|jgi:N-methylhydantoinase A|nr:hydantoinase/oxoprolinase family protein [Gemmatimonadales bacterium]
MRVGVDVGGTFTDLVAVAADGTLHIRKVGSTPREPAVGLFKAVDEFGTGKVAIAVLVHGTTVATNALLERGGARLALVTTSGFEDLLWLRRQDRPALYDLARDHPPPLVARSAVIGAVERVGPAGAVLPLTDREVARVTDAVRALAPPPEAVAVALLFAFRHPAHEQRLAAALRAALPAIPVVASHEILPVFREYERTSTTTAEAYLRPKISAYLSKTAAEAAARGVRALRIMTSSGGTLAPDAAAARAASLALSGPAGGVVGARLVGEAVGVKDLLTLDMGGTSADASLVSGGVAVSEGAETVAGIPLALPAILIETVSAGGGSIAAVDEGGALKVGPRSAGAEPGPACYGRGGTEATVTDACLALGWLNPAQPLADDVRLDPGAAERALSALGRALAGSGDMRRVAAGIVQVATAVMARALKRVSVARGIDPRTMALLPFGGAGPLFACALADALGMSRVVIPPHPGVLSALGLAAAPERVELLASCHRPLATLDARALASAFQPVLDVAAAAFPENGASLARFADCRFAGQGYEVTVAASEDDPAALAAAFRAAHRRRYGHADPDQPIELVNVRVTAERAVPAPRLGMRAGIGVPTPARREIVTREGTVARAEVWPLGELPTGLELRGPAVLAGPDATGLIEPGWRGTVHSSGAVVLERR